MKLNKETLKQIIKEELEDILDESRLIGQYSKDKEEEFKQYLRDMGKDPDEIIATLGPDSTNIMGQQFVDNYPKRMSFPMTRDRAIKKAWNEEMSKYHRTMESFYNADSSGTSPFSRVLKLLPELAQIPKVRKALLQVGGDPTKVTAKIGKRAVHMAIRIKTRELFDSLGGSLDKFK